MQQLQGENGTHSSVVLAGVTTDAMELLPGGYAFATFFHTASFSSVAGRHCGNSTQGGKAQSTRIRLPSHLHIYSFPATSIPTGFLDSYLMASYGLLPSQVTRANDWESRGGA